MTAGWLRRTVAAPRRIIGAQKHDDRSLCTNYASGRGVYELLQYEVNFDVHFD